MSTSLGPERSNPNGPKCQQRPAGHVADEDRVTEEQAMLAALPPVSALQAWVHRPQAVARCTVGDVFGMRALSAGAGRVGRGEELFMLNHYPCRMVQIVGWVASVEDKLDKMFITLDDGDGKNIISIQLRLQVHRPSAHNIARPDTPTRAPHPAPLAPASPAPAKIKQVRDTFLSAQQRKIRRDKELAAQVREAARLAAVAAEEAQARRLRQRRSMQKRPESAYTPGISEEYRGKRYARRDVRVGDTIRVTARVEEYSRRRAEGFQVVRQLWCDESSGGKLEVVHPDEQYTHAAQVRQLQETLYSKPFVMPQIESAPSVQAGPSRSILGAPCTPTKRKLVHTNLRDASPAEVPSFQLPTSADPLTVDTSMSMSFSDSLDLNSTMFSEMSSFADQALPDVGSLRSSQLTESTYRRYLLDYMIGQVQEAIDTLTRQGQDMLDQALHAVFPEFTPAPAHEDGRAESSQRSYGASTPLREIQQGVKRYGSYKSSFQGSDADETPKAFRSRATRQAAAAMLASQTLPISPLKFPSSSPMTSLPASPALSIPTFTLDALTNVPHLAQLGGSIADTTAKSNERRRRRRIRDGEATEKDRLVERDRIALGRRADEYHLSKSERRKEVLRMTRRAIREISQDGGVVQVGSSGGLAQQADLSSQFSVSNFTSPATEIAYIPITPPLIFPLLSRFIAEEEARRQRHFLTKGDPRRGHGILIPDLTKKLAEYGQDGKWERAGEWNVEDAILWGFERGKVIRKGEGYKLAV